MPHVLAVTDPDRTVDAVADDVECLLNRMATYLYSRGDPRAALPHVERACASSLARLGRVSKFLAWS